MTYTVKMTFVVEGADSMAHAALLIEKLARHKATGSEPYQIVVSGIDKVTSGRPE